MHLLLQGDTQMKNGLWFIGGFIAGIATLCAALVILHGWAPLAPDKPTVLEEKIQQKLLTLLDRWLAFSDVIQRDMPQNDPREAALASDLQTARSQIELYKVQHLDSYPPSGNFVNAMTRRTDHASTVMPVNGDPADYPYGPYLHHFPTNPFVSDSTSDKVEVEAGSSMLGGGNYGWHFDSSTGRLSADDDEHTSL